MRRGIAYETVSIALALAGAWVAAQLDLTAFEAGEIISSDAVNHNFQELAAAIATRQARVDGACAPGSSIRAVAVDGSVTCETDDTSGTGVDATVATDATLAGDGSSGAPLGIEVPVQLDGASNSTPTVHATNTSTGSAVLGEHVDGTRGYLGFEAYGVYGQHAGGNMGRLGSADDGVIGASESTVGIGVRGAANAATGTTYGTYGTAASPDGYAFWGENEATGAFGYVGGGWGAYGAHGNGDAAGVLGTATSGVLGMGIRGALASEFTGDVESDGNLTVSGTIDPPSSRTLKEDVAPIDGVAVVRTLATVPVATCRYAEDDSGAVHLGPMAEDFHEAFGLGANRESISTIDADGVALAAIQGLYLLVQERDARIARLEARLAALEAERGGRMRARRTR